MNVYHALVVAVMYSVRVPYAVVVTSLVGSKRKLDDISAPEDAAEAEEELYVGCGMYMGVLQAVRAFIMLDTQRFLHCHICQSNVCLASTLNAECCHRILCSGRSPGEAVFGK